ncbi:MAG: Eco57I restriction-modification methylase domain-containing protein [Bacteroidales bacterium]|nr:Eco57I restriction-modification methylase domain-containing protein [Bacteroidales bacterium]
MIGVKREQGVLADPEIEKKQQELLILRHKHFSARKADEKIALRKQDEALSQYLADLLKKDGFYNSADAQMMAGWNPYDQTKPSGFFDPYWMFGIKDGFDVVIGNPPYGAGFSEEEKKYFLQNYKSAKTIKGKQKGSLDTFSLFIENGFRLLNNHGDLGFIVPLTITSGDSMTALHTILFGNCETIKISSYCDRPLQIFKNAHKKISIISFRKTETICKNLLTTKMYRWHKGITLASLIDKMQFIDSIDYRLYGRLPKVGLNIEICILQKLFASQNVPIGKLREKESKTAIYYRSSGGMYFNVITNYVTGSTKERTIYLKKDIANVIGAVLSSNLFFWYQQVYSNGLDLKSYEIDSFTIPVEKLTPKTTSTIENLYKEYLEDIERNAIAHTTDSYANIDSFKEYKIRKSKHLIDKIDDIICPLYGLTKAETEFIKNYEIEFRVDG